MDEAAQDPATASSPTINPTHRCLPTTDLASIEAPAVCKWGNCGAVFADPIDFQDHVVEQHVAGKRSPHFNLFRCEWKGCLYGAARTKSNLKSHVKSHAPARRFLCVNCGYRFEHQHDLNQHQIKRGHLPYDKIVEWTTASLCRFLSTKNVGLSEESLELVQRYGITGRSILHDYIPSDLVAMLAIKDAKVAERLCNWLGVYVDMTKQYAHKWRRLSGPELAAHAPQAPLHRVSSDETILRHSAASDSTQSSSTTTCPSPMHPGAVGSPQYAALDGLQRENGEHWFFEEMQHASSAPAHARHLSETDGNNAPEGSVAHWVLVDDCIPSASPIAAPDVTGQPQPSSPLLRRAHPRYPGGLQPMFFAPDPSCQWSASLYE